MFTFSDLCWDIETQYDMGTSFIGVFAIILAVNFGNVFRKMILDSYKK